MTERQPEKKEKISLVETDAVYCDDEGESHLKTAELSKSGGSSDDE